MLGKFKHGTASIMKMSAPTRTRGRCSEGRWYQSLYHSIRYIWKESERRYQKWRKSTRARTGASQARICAPRKLWQLIAVGAADGCRQAKHDPSAKPQTMIFQPQLAMACSTASWPEEPSGPTNVDFLLSILSCLSSQSGVSSRRDESKCHQVVFFF